MINNMLSTTVKRIKTPLDLLTTFSVRSKDGWSIVDLTEQQARDLRDQLDNALLMESIENTQALNDRGTLTQRAAAHRAEV